MIVDALYFVPDKQIQEVEEETSKDATLQQLEQVITEGWPSQKQDIPSCIQPYYDLRDTLSVQNGVIVKGEKTLSFHTHSRKASYGNYIMHILALIVCYDGQEIVFWLNMTKDLRDTVNNCQPCQALRPANRKEPFYNMKWVRNLGRKWAWISLKLKTNHT